MRQRYPIVLASGQRWPDADAGHNLPPFNWVKVDNRGPSAVIVGLNAMPANDPVDYYALVAAGDVRVFNLGPPKENIHDSSDSWPRELHLLAPVGATTVSLEVTDYPLVDLSVLGAGAAGNNADGVTPLGNSILQTEGYAYLFNAGTGLWDRAHSANSGSLAPGGVTTPGIALVAPPGNFSVASAPAAGTAASASQASLPGGRNVCTNVSFGFSASTALAAASTATVNLRDGASGAGTIIKTWQFTLPAATVAPVHVELAGLSESGSGSTAMTLEFAAGVANLLTYCNLGGFKTY